MRFSASCVIKSKRKEVIVKKILKIWISIFGSPQKFLVDNGGEFNNHEFISLCQNVKRRICTTAWESPLSNSLVERHNVFLGFIVAKTITDAKSILKVALAWAVSAKCSLKNFSGFNPSQMILMIL